MDWRRRPLRPSKKPQSLVAPGAVYAEACARLRAAAGSSSPHVRESLAASIAAVERALGSPQAIDPSTKSALNDARSALRWMQAAHRFANGETTAREVIRSLTGDARCSRFDLGEAIRLTMDVRYTVASLIGRRDDGLLVNPGAVGEARALALIRALVPVGESPAATEAELRFLGGEEVEEFAAATLFFDIESRTAWESVESGIITATDPVVGFALASAFHSRAPWPPETDGQHSLDAFLRVVEHGLRRMMRPEIPEAYRRMIAHSLYGVTSSILDSQDDHEYQTGRPVSPKQRLYWTDLHMATAYRADSVFFGQGRVDVAEDESSDEGAWRAAIFGRREMLDKAVWLEACTLTLAWERLRLRRPGQEEALRRLAESLTASTQGMSPGSVVAMYEEIRQRANSGRANGWIAPPSSLASSADDLERWLVTMPGVGVLSSTGLGYWHVTFADQAGRLVETLLVDRVALPDEEVNEGVLEPGDHGGPAIEELDSLTRQLNEAIVGHAASGGKFAALDEALTSLLDNHATAILGQEIAATVRQHGLSTLLVLAGPEERTWPWEGLVVDDAGMTLAELVSIVHMPTLLPCATRDSSIKAGTFQCVRADGPANGSLVRSAWGLDDPVEADTSSAAFARACQSHGVLRLLMHTRISPAGGMFTHLPSGDRSISAGAVRALDLTGCGRVELWACPIHDLCDVFDTTLPYQGPTNVGSCFQLAGARVLLGCPWEVPNLVAGLLAVAFMREAPPPGSAAADARSLARAVKSYREVVRSGGLMERAVAQSLASQPSATAAAVAHAVWDGWQVAARHLSGQAVPESDTPDPPGAKIRSLMDPFRTPSAWAGWRVVARDRRCLSAYRREPE